MKINSNLSKIIFTSVFVILILTVQSVSTKLSIVSFLFFIYWILAEIEKSRCMKYIQINKEQYYDNIIKDSPMPSVIIYKKEILNSNDKFTSLFGNDKSILTILPTYKPAIGVQTALIKNDLYSIFTELIDAENDLKYILNFVRHNKQENLYDGNNTIVSLVFIDNYAEVTKKMDDARIPILAAMIDRKLSELADEIGGIVRKYEKEKYLLIFTEEKLKYLTENKFKIHDSIRKIGMGNKMPVTLSIAIGEGGKTIHESMEFAKAAMDLALGRGGDQVVVKNKEKYSFFGGKSNEIVDDSRVRARVKANALSELIEASSDVIIMGHRNPDLDSFGAAIGIYKIVERKGKKCKIILNQITSSINILYESIITEKEYSSQVFIDSDKAMQIIKESTLLIVVDCHISGIVECPSILQKTTNVVVLDHHRKSADFIARPVLTYHEPYASSTCELVTELMKYSNDIKLKDVEADALLAGITVDTKSFTFKTSAKTFEAAAFLKRQGADGIRVRMLLQYDLESYKAKSIAVNNVEIIHDNIAITICPANVENPTLTASQAADELLSISNVNASFVVSGDDNMVLICARSLRNMNVQVIMEKLGGGGHQTIAGAQILDMTLEEVIIKLKKSIKEYLEENV
jgi:cyclic-di-AMP phosphodiesterase